jgi:WD40 repeat protein
LEESRFIKSLAWSKTDNYLASGEQKDILRIWQLTDGRLKLLQTVQNPDDPNGVGTVHSIAWSNDKYLASSSNWDGNIEIRAWNPEAR